MSKVAQRSHRDLRQRLSREGSLHLGVAEERELTLAGTSGEARKSAGDVRSVESRSRASSRQGRSPKTRRGCARGQTNTSGSRSGARPSPGASGTWSEPSRRSSPPRRRPRTLIRRRITRTCRAADRRGRANSRASRGAVRVPRRQAARATPGWNGSAACSTARYAPQTCAPWGLGSTRAVGRRSYVLGHRRHVRPQRARGRPRRDRAGAHLSVPLPAGTIPGACRRGGREREGEPRRAHHRRTTAHHNPCGQCG